MTAVPTTPDAARAALAAQPGVPVWLDVPVLAMRIAARSTPSDLTLSLATATGDDLGIAHVYTREWYPGATQTRFSHYFLTLMRLFDGLERAGREQTVRLQLLRAVRALTPANRPVTVLLKFIIAPEYALPGGTLEAIYGCPLAAFYEQFVGVSRDVLRDRSEPTFTRGKAIHAGYRQAADIYLRTHDDAAARAAYLDGVRRSWQSDFSYLLLDRPKMGPRKLHTGPITAAEPILALCREQWGDSATDALLQERLVFAPSRGISGRADRIERRRGLIKLTEIKTGTSFGSERDPVTNQRHAGGIQALSYREVLQARAATNGAAIETEVEEIDDDGSTRVALATHPVLTRARATLDGDHERALDLLAQSRNVGYLAATGLLTGYDRHRLDDVARAGRFLNATGGDWNLYGSAAPCEICAVSSRAICERTRRPLPAPLYNLFRYAPPALFAYWARFHRQLVDAERTGREWLYHLATTPAARLERQEGVTLTGLRVREIDGPIVRLGREAPLETRIREDDTILLTPDGLAPGDGSSIEGTIQTVAGRELTVRLRDRLDDRRLRYRIDELGKHDLIDWQKQGLTDFLVTAMDATPVRGRAVAETELPPLTQTLLGVTDLPPLPAAPPVPAVVKGLNASQRRAVGAALSLDPKGGAPLLVQGPPGTGKTTMIAELAHAIAVEEFARDEPAASERPLLILANSHRAVDEVVLKLLDRYPELQPYIVRAGTPRAGMDERVRTCLLTEQLGVEPALGTGDFGCDGPTRLVALIREGNLIHDQAMIFAATLGAASRPELRGLSFRTVIVDETGQATEPAALQALRHLPAGYRGRLILIGDHLQLPPVVADDAEPPMADVPPELATSGLTDADTLRTSLFERLARRYPARLITLDQQYRMNDLICRIISRTFYDGRLTTGASAVAARRLTDRLSALGVTAPKTGLLATAPPVLLIDTAEDPQARDSVTGFRGEEARDNQREATIIARLVVELFNSLSPATTRELASEIGIISPYRRQNNRIRQALGEELPNLGPAIRVDTVDRFQGGERDIIIVSLTNSNPGRILGNLHTDWRRMNVALSRARRLLVIVGDRQTFTTSGRPEEESAKVVYRRLFREIDALVESGDAAIVPSSGLGD